MSLRARLLIATVVLVAAGLVVANVATYRALSGFLIHRVDDQLVAASPTCAHVLLEGPGGGPRALGIPVGTFAEFIDPSGNVVGPTFFVSYPPPSSNPPRPVIPTSVVGSSGASYFTTGSVGGTSLSYRVLATETPNASGTLIVAIPLTEVGATMHRLLLVELVVSGLVLVLAAAFGLWVVRLGLRPLEGIGQTAGAIAAGDLTRRVEPADERTEVGRLGLALNSMLAQIEAAFEERRASENRLRRFVADASHELRTPITSIRGYSELFRRGAESRPADLAKSMEAIEAEAARMGVLVDDLLLLARLDQGRRLERELVDLARVATDAVEAARAVEPDRSINLEAGGPAEVLGDAGRLRQVLDNLLENVRVHTPAGSPVEVSVRPDADAVVLSVTDHGPGLPPEVAGRAFERFYRGDPSRSRTNGGAGLGLAIVAAIVEAHGGTVNVTSPNDGGATFEARIPAGGRALEERVDQS
jgi:two-component system, OmpR family, sensor kinase